MIPLEELHSPLQKFKILHGNSLITILLVLITTFITINMFSVPVFAAETLSSAKSYVNEIALLITNIFNPSAVLCFGLALIKIVLSKNSKDVEDAMKWAKSILIAFVIFNIGGTFMNWVSSINGMNHSITYNATNLSDAIKAAKN